MDNNGWRERLLLKLIEVFPDVEISKTGNAKEMADFFQHELHTAIEEERKRFVEDLKRDPEDISRDTYYNLYNLIKELIDKYSPSDKETT